MTYPSRHKRPLHPARFELQPRDRRLLQSIYRHRYLLAHHVHQLHFTGVSLRVAQQRLRRLWEHGYVDRLFVPIQHDGGVTLSPPLYSLAALGAQVVGCDINVAWRAIPHTPKANAKGYATVQHNLVAADFLVAAECHNTESLSVTTAQETDLRRQLAQARNNGRWRAAAVVPDGAITMFPRGNVGLVFPRENARPATYYLEVVRAGARGGNKSLLRKCALYANLHHRGFFRSVFGHDHVRAVLILTTSAERAENLRKLVARLPHGRNLFWFGAFRPSPPGSLVPAVGKDDLLAPRWRTCHGTSVAFIPRPPATVAT